MVRGLSVLHVAPSAAEGPRHLPRRDGVFIVAPSAAQGPRHLPRRDGVFIVAPSVAEGPRHLPRRDGVFIVAPSVAEGPRVELPHQRVAVPARVASRHERAGLLVDLYRALRAWAGPRANALDVVPHAA